MLTALLNTIPLTKFVLIEDTLQERGRLLFDYLINLHKQRCSKINYFVFEGAFGRIRQDCREGDVVLHDCVTQQVTLSRFEKEMIESADGAILVIDSLANVLINYGFGDTYRILQKICSNKNCKQLIALLHLDVLEEAVKTTRCLQHLATCSMRLVPQSDLNNSKIQYTYKKSGGKVVRQAEEFSFENGTLITKPVRKLDPKVLLQDKMPALLPESLTTFKISLDEKEKQLRDKLVLPYLPIRSEEPVSRIFYEFDNVDDWDEEDPDDDLDI